MALSTNPSNWLAWSLNWKNFTKYGITESQFDQLALKASERALKYVLTDLKVPQSTLDQSLAGDEIEIAFQKLTAYEFLELKIGAYVNTIAFEEIQTAENQRVKQRDEDLDRWLNLGRRLKKEALLTLQKYSINYKPFTLTAYTYNNC